MQAVHHVLCYMEGYRKVLEAGTGEQQTVWVEYELQKQWDLDNIEMPGISMEEKIQYMVDTETSKYKMIKRLDFVNALFDLFRSFEVNFKHYTDNRHS